MDTSDSDPSMERSAQRGDTGLEDSMRQLSVGGGRATDAEPADGDSSYPERPNEPDCIYYLRTGFCRYGVKCRFNHPHDRPAQAYGGPRAGGGDYPARPGQYVCQYYMRTGSCKFGSSCKYHHPKHGAGSTTTLALNFHGYPLRPGEKECSYYMRTGQCKFADTCKFHHPQPANVQVPEGVGQAIATGLQGPSAIHPSVVYPTVPHVASSQQFGVEAVSWQMARPPMVPGSYVQGPYGSMLFSTGVVPIAGWTPYMSTVGAGQLYGVPPISTVAPMYTGPYPPMNASAGPSNSTDKEQTHPERPGQPECQHYLRTGECKYGSLCRYHHPSERCSEKPSYTLTPVVLPLRPGAPTCTYFMQHGVCKFGPICKFNHPMDSLSYSPSTSSLYDMPVAPYPMGYSIATVAPPSLLSDSRTEAISGSKDLPTEISSLPSVSIPRTRTQEPSKSPNNQATTPSSTSGQ